VTGSVAAYKAARLAKGLSAIAEVRVFFTAAAAQLVTPAAFRRVSGLKAQTSLFHGVHPLSPDLPSGAHPRVPVPHIDDVRDCDLVLVAPASADFLGKLAHGLADDLLSTACLYSTAPLWIAPAMNVHMWRHAAVQENARILRARGATFLGPGAGLLACGDEGVGRMREPEEILDEVREFLAERNSWSGRRVLVTAGPTRETLDPVRFLTNRSSGRMGYALAEAAARRGAQVTLITGPTQIATPSVQTLCSVETAVEMGLEIRRALPKTDLVIMAAAVADYRSAAPTHRKMKKTGKTISLKLAQNPDLLADILRRRKPGQLVVGFAAETHDLMRNAQAKLARKPCDLLAANRVGKSRGMETEDNEVTLFFKDGTRPLRLARAPKWVIARQMLEVIDRCWPWAEKSPDPLREALYRSKPRDWKRLS